MTRRSLALTLAVSTLALAGCGSSSSSTSRQSGSSTPKTTAQAPSTTTAASPTTTGATPTTGSTTTGTSTAKTSTSPSTDTATSPKSSTELGFESVPIEQGAQIAPASSTGTKPVDGISCAPQEQLAYHIHVHLQVYDDGQPRSLPGGIGIPGSQVETIPQYGPVAEGGSCIYWLHTHAPDGVIHIESPTQKIYTLGEFFDEWHQPLTSTQIGTIQGKQSWSVNGKPWTKDPRDIPLNAHATIQVSVGEPLVPFQKVDWAATQL